MKKIIYFISLTLALSACKYEDGPKFSLRSKTHRAVNTWYLDKVLENGTDKTSDYKNAYVNYQVSIKADKTYELKYRPFNIGDYTETGNWDFSSDKLFINFTPKSGNNNTSKWKILRLKETETWVMQTIDGKDLELHLKD